MNVKALLHLRRVVNAAPDNRFNMARFTTNTDGCATAFCAAGWFALDPRAQKHTAINEVLFVDHWGFVREVNPKETFAGLARIFDIDLIQTHYLFGGYVSPGDSPLVTRHMVIANINLILAGKDPVKYPSMDDGEVIH